MLYARPRASSPDALNPSWFDARALIRFATRAVLPLAACALILPVTAAAQKRRRPPAIGRVAVVADERLAALRDAPGFQAALIRRLGRGSLIALTGTRAAKDGATFYRVAVTRRTSGWLQAEAFISTARAGDDERLLRLARGSESFDRLARGRIFLDAFPRSPLRPAALLLFGDAAEAAADRLSREARRRLSPTEMEAGGAPLASYYLNFNGLDRLNRLGVKYVFDSSKKQFHYDGAAWREILRRHPRSPEATWARKRLESLTAATK
jgi:hypothetical protein